MASTRGVFKPPGVVRSHDTTQPYAELLLLQAYIHQKIEYLLILTTYRF